MNAKYIILKDGTLRIGVVVEFGWGYPAVTSIVVVAVLDDGWLLVVGYEHLG